MIETKKSQKIIQECPLCGTPYENYSVRIVKQSDMGSLLYFKCVQCASGLVASVVEAPFGLLGSGLITDLHYEEVSLFLKSPPITEDDAIDFYGYLHRRPVKRELTKHSIH